LHFQLLFKQRIVYYKAGRVQVNNEELNLEINAQKKNLVTIILNENKPCAPNLVNGKYQTKRRPSGLKNPART